VSAIPSNDIIIAELRGIVDAQVKRIADLELQLGGYRLLGLLALVSCDGY
jgi:hypothetical protein